MKPISLYFTFRRKYLWLKIKKYNIIHVTISNYTT